jgi:tryptophan synthase
MKLLCKLADSFIYVVSRMGVTGATGTMNAGLPDLLRRVKEYSGNVPAAVGFGVSTRDHFLSVAQIADGVVIGSQIITTVNDAPAGEEAKHVEEYCAQVCGRRGAPNGGLTREVGIVETMDAAHEPNGNNVTVDAIIKDSGSEPGLADQIEALNTDGPVDPELLSQKFGEFGGQYVPESLMDCLSELERGFNAIKDDPAFWEEYRTYYPWMGRPGQLHEAERLTEYAGGARIWLKREDLNHTGSHKINNALGQILLARRLGKTEIIAETGAGQHGVATATVCAKFGMKCTIYMGAVSRKSLYCFPLTDNGIGRCKTSSTQRFQN